MKNKNGFLICQRVWKTIKSQGKIKEKSGNFEVDDKWQPSVNKPCCVGAMLDYEATHLHLFSKIWYNSCISLC